MRGLLQRAGEPQHLVGALARCGLDRGQPGAADSECPGLIEHHGVGACQRLQRTAALDQNAAAGRLRDAGDERDRRRENERAGRRGNQHGKAAHRIAGEEPRGARDNQRDRQQQQRITIGQANERRLRGLRRARHAHDAGIGALACQRRGVQLKTLAGIDGSAVHGFAGLAQHRQGLTGQHRLVDRGRAADDDAVDRDHFAGAHQHGVANCNGVDRHVVDSVVAAAMRDARCAINQRGEVALGAGDRKILQNVAAGIHHRDHDAGEIFAEHEACRHRHEGNGIDAGAASEEIADHRDEEPERNRRSPRGPDPAGEIGAAARPGDEAGDQRTDRDCDQGFAEQAGGGVCRHECAQLYRKIDTSRQASPVCAGSRRAAVELAKERR